MRRLDSIAFSSPSTDIAVKIFNTLNTSNVTDLQYYTDLKHEDSDSLSDPHFLMALAELTHPSSENNYYYY